MVNYDRYQHMIIERHDKVATVTLNRPEILNAVGPQLHWELAHIFEDLRLDDEVYAAVITGAGRGFCSGGERGREAARQQRDQLPALRQTMREARKIIHDILELDKPLVAAVNGPAVGLGATVALFCDVIIASEQASFGDPHVRVGVVAGDGGAIIWPLLVGVAKAKELLMTGDIIDAREALRIGLVNRVVLPEELMPTAMDLAQRLAKGPPLAIRGTKRALNKRLREDVNLVLDVSLGLEEQTMLTEDRIEAGKAWAEKRPGVYTGR